MGAPFSIANAVSIPYPAEYNVRFRGWVWRFEVPERIEGQTNHSLLLLSGKGEVFVSMKGEPLRGYKQ